MYIFFCELLISMLQNSELIKLYLSLSCKQSILFGSIEFGISLWVNSFPYTDFKSLGKLRCGIAFSLDSYDIF
jgi:hypothetical protein